MRKNGYEGLSDDLNKELEDTLNDITYNSEKQEQVISNMLNNVVNNYQQAYDKIQQIINSTGFVPNGSLSNNIGSLVQVVERRTSLIMELLLLLTIDLIILQM